MRLICDTSIWYKLSEKKELLCKFENYELVSTLNSFLELTTSPNFLKAKKNLSALDLMCKHSQFIPQNQWEYITEDTNLQNKWVVNAFNRFKTLTINPNISEINFNNNQTVNWVDERKQAAKKTSDCINEEVENIKKYPNLNPGKKEINKLHELYKEKIIKKFVSIQTEQFYNLNQTRITNWDNSQFFLTMFTNYIILLVKSEQKSKPNDIADLYNMIYVKPTDKYLTNDKKTWLNISNQNSDTSKQFLYFADFII